MEIYNKEPIKVLWDITKGLMFNLRGVVIANGIPIFKEVMAEEDEDVPDSYIVLRSQITDTTSNFGDGKSLIRSADCDIILVSKGYAEDTTDLHNVNKEKIRKHLKDQEISFNEVNLGYSDTLKSTQHTFSLEVNYIG